MTRTRPPRSSATTSHASNWIRSTRGCIAARRDLARARRSQTRAQLILGERLSEIYKSEDLGLLDVLLNAGDLTDVGTHLDYIELVHRADADAGAVAALTRRVAGPDGRQIEGARCSPLPGDRPAPKRAADVEDKLAEREALLATLDARVNELLRSRAA